jgi:hypothetical protein
VAPHPLVTPGTAGEQIGRLLAAVLIIMMLPSLPFGGYIVYPFTILTTWFHEMGHGMTALLIGQDFQQLQIFPSGSGVAMSRVDDNISPLASAAIAAGGPLAPCLAGSLLIVASAHPKLWRPVLWGMAAALFVSVIIYVRSPVGYFVLPLVGAGVALIAWRAPDRIIQFALQFLGVLGALSMLRDFDYLFSESAVINGQPMLSDTGQIEQALWLPHWFWAAVILGLCAAMVGASLKYTFSNDRWRQRPNRLPDNVLQFRDTSRK